MLRLTRTIGRAVCLRHRQARLTMACRVLDRMRALMEGRVSVDGFELINI